MRVLVIGSGGREHALVWKLSQSPKHPELFCAPGNVGTASIATNVDLQATNVGALALWALENKIDLTIVGPEAPLAEGIVDTFTQHGLRIFGPVRAAARLEASKSFAKEVMLKAGVDSGKGAVFEDYLQAKAYVEREGAPIVIKADGLAAGKGVVVATTLDEALAALKEFMVDSSLGESGKRVVIEECLFGEEASVIAIVDGATVLPLVVSQDYKRAYDNNEGPNTGGMGAISPTPVLSDKRVENLVGEIFLPVLRELGARGIKYVGFLYAGIMVTRTGEVKVIEFNCRLGDPETQVLMMRLNSDLLTALEAAVDGKLSTVDLRWRPESAACVVCASAGYPREVEDRKAISGLFEPEADLQVFHCGTYAPSDKPSEVRSKGGRILTVTALGSSMNDAVTRAYEGVARVSFEGMHFRKDIGGGAW